MTFLYEDMNTLRDYGNIKELPSYIPKNLNPNFELRPYQKEAFENFITHFEGNKCPHPTQVLFHMATGSGKTLIMAGLMIYLYKKGYRNFLFFVNLSNIVEKTKENFLNSFSSKYLFAQEIEIDGERVRINQVDNFQYADSNAINVCFTTTQGLHTDMWLVKENKMSFEDFNGQKVVLISDEAHHLNVATRNGQMSTDEERSYHSWEETVQNIFGRDRDNVLLEFTATCDLANQAIHAAYERKIVFNYPLTEYYNDKYSKEIVTMLYAKESPLMDRALQALVLSQYRLKIFQTNRLAIKPVVLFKSQHIADSDDFKTEFIKAISTLSGVRLQDLSNKTNGNAILDQAFSYFKTHDVSFDTLAAELKDDFSAEHCVSVNDDNDVNQKQILLNSLEDATNPYRAIFEVKKLDEGWDVLNLFDIVRLYETRQGGKKISQTTISEAQLIGRGARYCPFQLDDEQPKFQRKYDDDVDNELRVCETLYYHCMNDSKYISELHEALREIGLPLDKNVFRQYVLKPKFKADDVYKNGLVFINDRIVRDRKEVHGLQPTVRNNIYTYRAGSGSSGSYEIMDDSAVIQNVEGDFKSIQITIKDIASINYAIVNKALMKYPIYKFDGLKSYFPNLSSVREFIMDDNYLGSVKINIQSKESTPSVGTLYSAVFSTVGKIATAISGIEETYQGTKEFRARKMCEIFRDKTVEYSDPHDEGVGVSQNDSHVRQEWRIDLTKEDWFAYTDNFGTSEEKAFVAYFKGVVERLKGIYDKVYLIRNEREFHIYSFTDGERFEPDYVLLLQRNNSVGYEQLQIFIEPKGSQLLERDRWKEDFLLELKDQAVPVTVFVDDNKYRIWGFHFFNQANRMAEFNGDFEEIFNYST